MEEEEEAIVAKQPFICHRESTTAILLPPIAKNFHSCCITVGEGEGRRSISDIGHLRVAVDHWKIEVSLLRSPSSLHLCFSMLISIDLWRFELKGGRYSKLGLRSEEILRRRGRVELGGAPSQFFLPSSHPSTAIALSKLLSPIFRFNMN